MRLHLTSRFFWAAFGSTAIVVLSYSYPWLYMPSVVLVCLIVAACIFEYIWIHMQARHIHVARDVSDQLSLGDTQTIGYRLANNSTTDIHMSMTDELPYQLQYRDYVYEGVVAAGSRAAFSRDVRPTRRGAHSFGNMHTFLAHPLLRLLQLQKTFDLAVETAVYPSFIQMKKYELQVFSQTATLAGIRKVRQIGENDEFEQIRNYVVGDNRKSINWRATSRKGELMVNQYENSKSQLVYCIIDKGRPMRMPFDDLTLLDYSINTALVTANIILRKYDKIGLITFSNKVGSIINADSQKGQIQKITKALYDQRTDFQESDFRLLYQTIRNRIKRRSVLLLFTNFEHQADMRRQLSYLKSLNKNHLLVVIFFTNAEIEAAANAKVGNVEELYFRTFAQENIVDKERMVSELRRNGIQVILSQPQNLSINTINKYLEIKSKRMR